MSEILAFGTSLYVGSRIEFFQYLCSGSDDSFSYVVTPNVNHIVKLRRDSRLEVAYSEAEVRLCDSRIIGRLMKMLKKPVEVYPGSDLTADMLSMANEKGWTVSILGADVKDVEVLKRNYLGVRFEHHNPPMGFVSDPVAVESALRFIEERPAQLVLLAVGCPRQEYIACELKRRGKARGIGLCIGASVLFLSGALSRAPLWIQKLGLEWLYRIFSEPRRLFGRYAHDAILFLPIVIGEFRKRHQVNE